MPRFVWEIFMLNAPTGKYQKTSRLPPVPHVPRSKWKDADTDIPVLQQAKAEYSRIQ